MPVQAWLELQCQMISGAEAGLVVIGASQRAPGASAIAWPSDAPPRPRLAVTVEAAHERGKLVIQAPGEGNAASDAVTHLAVPITLGSQCAGAFGVTVRGLPAAEAKALAGLLGHGARGLALLLETGAAQETLAGRLSLAGTLLDHGSLREAGHALVVSLAQGLGCDRVALGLTAQHAVDVAALSSSPRFASESDDVRDLRAAMDEAIAGDAVIELPAAGDAVHDVRANEQLMRSSGAAAVTTIPLVAHDRAVGALVCEWAEPAADGVARRRGVEEAALLCGPILELMQRAEAGWLSRVRTGGRRWVDRHFGADHGLAKSLLAAGTLLLLLLAVVPGTYRVSARASLEGRVQRALVAGVDGYLAESHARAGDLVAAGDILARLDDRDLRLERRERASETAQLETEYREALAGGDRMQVSLLQARMEQAAAQFDLADEKLGRTQISAPFDGIVLSGDLSQSLGSPVELGAVLFEIAPLDGYRIILEVDGRDIADVDVAQSGRLALEALPGEPLALVVERITPVSTTRDGRSYFRAEAVLEAPRAELRPGMQGIAKIEIGQRRLLWIWTHELFDWLRLRAWSLAP